jgi:AcrR family transcriptional regulator
VADRVAVDTSPAAGEPRVTKRQVKTAQRREAVLRAAFGVFSERGFNNASLTEIAERADMTHAGVLHHFGSKERLLIEVLRYRDGRGVDGLSGEPPEGAALLPHLVRTVGENEAKPGIVQAFSVLAAESVTDGHPAQQYFRDRMASLRSVIADALADRTGRPRDDVAVTDGAAALIAVMDGLQIQWLLSPEEISMQRAAKLVIDAVTQYLEPPAPPS